MKKYIFAVCLLFMSVLCFSEVFDYLSPDCTPSDFITQLSDAKIDYSVSGDEADKIVTVNNIEIYTPVLPAQGKSVYGDVLVYFKSDRFYKTETRHHDAELFKKAKQQCEADCSGNKTEVESGQQYIIEDEGLMCTLMESSGEYTMLLEYNRSLIPISIPWYKIRLNPREYEKKTLILDEVAVSFSTYEGTVADGIGYDYEIVAFYAETDGDGHITSPYSIGRNFIFCMPKDTGEQYLQAAHDKKGIRMIADEVKCGLYKMRGNNDNWYVVMFNIGDADIR